MRTRMFVYRFTLLPRLPFPIPRSRFPLPRFSVPRSPFSVPCSSFSNLPMIDMVVLNHFCVFLNWENYYVASKNTKEYTVKTQNKWPSVKRSFPIKRSLLKFPNFVSHIYCVFDGHLGSNKLITEQGYFHFTSPISCKASSIFREWTVACSDQYRISSQWMRACESRLVSV